MARIGLIGLIGLIGPIAAAQEVPAVKARGFTAPIADAGGRVMFLVAGNEARPVAGLAGLLVTGFRMETYRYAPARLTNFVVEAPAAQFASASAFSDGPIRVRSLDGRLDLSGQGWSWQDATGRLVISNAVETLLRVPGRTSAPPFAIRSHRFEYSFRSGDAAFLEAVGVRQEGRLALACSALRTSIAPDQTAPGAITADGALVVEVTEPGREARITGAHAVFRPAESGDEIEVTGDPRWEIKLGEGAAENLRLFPDERRFVARGAVRMSLRAALLRTATAPVPGAAQEAAPPGADARIAVTAGYAELAPGTVLLKETVTLSQPGQLELRCAEARIELNAQDAVREATASGGVEVALTSGDDTHRLRGRDLVLTIPAPGDERVEVSGDPVWEARGLVGHGSVIVLRARDRSLDARAPASVVFPARAGGAAGLEITGDLFSIRPGTASFTGGVTARDPAWTLRAPGLVCDLGTNNAVRRLAAQGGVTLDYAGRTNAPPAPPAAGDEFRLFAFDGSGPWRITAAEMSADLDAAGTNVVRVVGAGEVAIERAGLRASGGRVAHDAVTQETRLEEHPLLELASGVVVQGQPGAALVIDGPAGRFRIEGPVEDLQLPAALLRGAGRARATPEAKE